VVSESRVTWPTSVLILIFLGLYVLDLGRMYATDRQMSDAYNHLMPPTQGAGHNNQCRALKIFYAFVVQKVAVTTAPTVAKISIFYREHILLAAETAKGC